MSLKFRLPALALAAALGACSTLPSPAPSSIAPFAEAPETTGVAAHAMVAAANPMAVEAGLAVLRRGGSAADVVLDAFGATLAQLIAASRNVRR